MESLVKTISFDEILELSKKHELSDISVLSERYVNGIRVITFRHPDTKELVETEAPNEEKDADWD